MRVVLDTNILARAMPGRNTPATELLDRVVLPPHLLILSPFLLMELSRVLRYERVRRVHGFDDDQIGVFLQHIESAAFLVIPPDPPVSVVPSDPDDDAILAIAVAGSRELDT